MTNVITKDISGNIADNARWVMTPVVVGGGEVDGGVPQHDRHVVRPRCDYPRNVRRKAQSSHSVRVFLTYGYRLTAASRDVSTDPEGAGERGEGRADGKQIRQYTIPCP